MRLKRLDMVGFKSFLDRTVMQFDDGVTGVVGPNGCGKSNIVDAIRWVLGEQSPKHLRGSAMQDVIFSGSQSKAPVNMAEVTLTFVNDNPEELPARYRNFSEIAVTRRLFRSGESDYLINKTSSRLLDITELFLGTGVGTKAYSIIEQGRIGMIVSAKAEDRRALIEEAAGITRYKSKRKIAERRMEHTRTNLLRVGDITAELGKRLDSLSRQAKKAERFRRLKTELREIELHIAAHRWLEIAAACSWLSKEIEIIENSTEKLSGNIENLERDLRARRDRLSAEEAQLSTLQSNAVEAEGQARLHMERVAGAGREQENICSRSAQAEKDIHVLKSRRQELCEELKLDRRLLEEIESKIQINHEKLESESGELERSIENVSILSRNTSESRHSLSEIKNSITRAESQISSFDRRQSDLEIRKNEGEQEIEKLVTRLSSIEDTHGSISAELEDFVELQLSLESEYKSTQDELVQCRNDCDSAEERLSGIKDLLSQKSSRLQSLLDIRKSYDGCATGVRNLMLQKENIEDFSADSVMGLVADIVKPEPVYEAAIEAVLGDRLQRILVRSRDDALSAIRWLSGQESGRSTFIPVEEFRDKCSSCTNIDELRKKEGFKASATDIIRPGNGFTKVLKDLLSDVVIVENMDAAIKLWDKTEDITFVTLAGELLEPSGALTGGSRDAVGAGMLGARREIEELGVEVENLKADLSEITDRRDMLRYDRSRLENLLESLQDKVQTSKIELVGREKEVQRISDEKRLVNERLQAVNRDVEKIAAFIRESRTEAESISDNLNIAKARQEEILNSLSMLEEELLKAQEHVSSQRDLVTSLRIAVAENKEKREGIHRQIENAERRISEIDEREKSLLSILEGSGEQLDALRLKALEDEAEAKRLINKAEQMQIEVTRGRETLQSASSAVKKDEEKLDAMREALKKDSALANKLEMDYRELSLEAGHISDTVQEKHATDISHAVHEWHLFMPPEDDQIDRLETIKKKIERIGDVNLTAIEEYKEIDTRHSFLKSQKEDLENSLIQLEKAISRIDKTSRTRFRETFKKINDLFAKVFPRLFDGGSAGLSLTDESDPLNSGVDIFAQPPGKKLQNVNLLSGGEKALTATSLIFAIFLVRPTPFCLLDEVDAPLDDQNLKRYNQLVREMSRRSQFILVTHSKSTMETVDTLYGVTMEEPGVSKLVNVKLSDEPSEVAA